MLRALRHFLKFCKAAGLIDLDPSEGVTRVKMKNTGGFMPWSEDHVAKFEATHPVGTKARWPGERISGASSGTAASRSSPAAWSLW